MHSTGAALMPHPRADCALELTGVILVLLGLMHHTSACHRPSSVVLKACVLHAQCRKVPVSTELLAVATSPWEGKTCKTNLCSI